MLNTWVKNVNNWRVGVGISQGYLNTVKLSELQFYITNWVQRHLFAFIITIYTPIISTIINIKTNLLNKSYPSNPQHLLLRLKNEI